MIACLLLFLPVSNALIKQGRILFFGTTVPICTWVISLPLCWYLGYDLQYNGGPSGFWIGLGIGYALALVILSIGLALSDWEKLSKDAQIRTEQKVVTHKDDELEPLTSSKDV